MNSKNTDDTPSVSRGRHSRIEVGDGRSFLEFQDAMKILTTTISGKWQSRIRGRRKSRLRGSVFVHFKRHVRFAPPHRYRENGNRRDAPLPLPRSSLRTSNARFHYRHPTSPARYCALYFARYADAGPCYAALHSEPRSVLTAQNFGNGLARSCPRPPFPLAI